MKMISSNPNLLELAVSWLRESPVNAAIGCMVAYALLWVISYKLKDLI